MKKVLLICTFIGLTLTSFAQELEFGVKGGISMDQVNLNDLQGLKTSVEGVNTINFGLYGRFKVKVIGFYVQPELIYNRRASNFTINDVSLSGGKVTFSHSANYVDVPVLFGFKMIKLFRIYGGPNFQFLVNQKTDLPDLSSFKKEDLKSQTTGIQLGVGLDLLKLRIDAKYDFNPSNMGSPFTFNSTTPTIKNGMFMFQIGYKIFGIL